MHASHMDTHTKHCLLLLNNLWHLAFSMHPITHAQQNNCRRENFNLENLYIIPRTATIGDYVVANRKNLSLYKFIFLEIT